MQAIVQNQNGGLPGLTDADTPSALALGFFDGVHRGHAAVVGAAAQAAREGGLRAAAVTFADNPRGVGLLMQPEQKRAALAALGVELLVELRFELVKDMTPEAFVRDILIGGLHARAVFCGFNYRFGRGASGDAGMLRTLCAQHGASVSTLPPVCSGGEPVSSTRIRGLLERGEVEAAAVLLGRPFGIEGDVVHGRQIGRTLGTPTINQYPFSQMAGLREGVYASAAFVRGEWMPSVTNIGSNPTVGGVRVVWETYIPDFSGDLYGHSVRVALRRFLRDERKFASLDELREQMREDARQARAE